MGLKTFLIFLFVAIIAISAADAQSLLGIVNVNGTLYCTENGSPGANGNATPVFPNATVDVVCSSDVTAFPTINATTNADGLYRVYVLSRNNATVDLIISNCRVFVPTPLSNCNPTLPSTGLVSNLRFIRTHVPIGFVGLRSTYMVPAGFTLQV